MERAPTSSAAAQSAPPVVVPASGRAVELDPRGAIVPLSCSCCGEPAVASRLETRASDGATLIVPYCSACLLHASRAATRALSVTLASAVLSLSVALALPLAWVFVSPAVYALAVVVAAFAPFVPLVAKRTARRPHSSRGKGAWWLRSGALYCTRPEFAAALAQANDGRVTVMQARQVIQSPWMAAGPVLGLIVAPFAWWLLHPLVRIVDVTDTAIVVQADGHRVARVEPTQGESPVAGVEIRLPVGRHRLRAVAPSGKIVDDIEVSVRPGAVHLYAPASPATCFWLETTGYGRTRPAQAERVPLGGGVRFWALPLAVDTWFAPNPPEGADGRSTGGVLTALRQAPCNESPPGVGNP